MHGGQAAVAAPERRADGFDDDDVVVGEFGHVTSSGSAVTRRIVRGCHDRRRASRCHDASRCAGLVRRSVLLVLARSVRQRRRSRRATTVDDDASSTTTATTTGDHDHHHDRDDHDRDRPRRPPPCPGAGTTDADRQPRRRRPTALLTDGRRSPTGDCADRVVVRLHGDGRRRARLPRSTYGPGPFTQDGSGEPVDGRGQRVPRRCGASRRTATTSRPARTTYTGPEAHHARPARSHVRELVETGDFEGVLTWVIGLDGKRPFTVTRPAAARRTARRAR